MIGLDVPVTQATLRVRLIMHPQIKQARAIFAGAAAVCLSKQPMKRARLAACCAHPS